MYEKLSKIASSKKSEEVSEKEKPATSKETADEGGKKVQKEAKKLFDGQYFHLKNFLQMEIFYHSNYLLFDDEFLKSIETHNKYFE